MPVYLILSSILLAGKIMRMSPNTSLTQLPSLLLVQQAQLTISAAKTLNIAEKCWSITKPYDVLAAHRDCQTAKRLVGSHVYQQDISIVFPGAHKNCAALSRVCSLFPDITRAVPARVSDLMCHNRTIRLGTKVCVKLWV